MILNKFQDYGLEKGAWFSGTASMNKYFKNENKYFQSEKW